MLVAAIGAVWCTIYGHYVEFCTLEFSAELDQICADFIFFLLFFNIYAILCNCMGLDMGS